MEVQETKVKDLTIEQFKNLIRETVLNTLESYLVDQDEDLTIKEDVKQQLLAIQQRRKTRQTSLSATEVYDKLGIKD